MHRTIGPCRRSKHGKQRRDSDLCTLCYLLLKGSVTFVLYEPLVAIESEFRSVPSVKSVVKITPGYSTRVLLLWATQRRMSRTDTMPTRRPSSSTGRWRNSFPLC